MDPTDATLRGILARTRTIAVVGLSDRPERDSFQVARYLATAGYRIVPVNPNLREGLGGRAYPDLDAVPPSVPIDLVDVFRRSAAVPPIAEATARRGVPVLWLQLGVTSEAAAATMRAAGGIAIEDRCLMVEHRRLGVPPLPVE